MTQESTKRTRPTTAGCAALAVTALLGLLIGVGLFVAYAVPGFFDRPQPSAQERLAKKVGLTEYRLRQAVQDGRLTDEEIEHAAGTQWHVEREQEATRVVVGYEPGPTCYRFDVPASLEPKATVDGERLEQCPALQK
ncbi:hypothetical protein ACQEVG_18040 [Streptomyces sp. CA-135486]|uniref:hypothetical protein n=1 Tax=Streptomyces sp. CA-135486 TaxID=3240049 RepID=UPI003D8C2679